MITLNAMLFGLAQVFSWPGILIPIAGTLLAMVASFLPGLGHASVALLAMVLTLHWDNNSVMLLFGAITGGATFMGSVTAILFNIPGSVSSTPALLEGYPLSRKGLTRTALACAATASAVGSVFGVIVLIAILPFAEPWVLKFGPLEMLLVSLLGLLTIILVPSQSAIRSAIMTCFGLLVSLIGSNPLDGHARWNFGFDQLGEGIGMVPMLLGIFTIAELIEWMRPSQLLRSEKFLFQNKNDTTLAGFLAVFRNFGLTLRSSMIGTLVGIVPGIGGTVAGFVAYGHAVQSDRKDAETFGHGNIKGLIAPEAAVDAKDGGSLLPTLALGIPGSEACVILLAVFSAHGLVPGTPMLTTHLALTYTLIFSLLFSNLLTSVVGVSIAPVLSKLNQIQIHQIALPCLLICAVNVIEINGRIVDFYVMMVFGILGYFWRAAQWPRIPFVIAFVLGRLIEQNFELSVQLVRIGRIGFLQNSATIALMFLIAITLGWSFVAKFRQQKPKSALPYGLGLSVLAVALSSLLLGAAMVEPGSGQSFSTGVAAMAFALSVANIVWVGFQTSKDRQWSHWASDFAVPGTHRAGFLLILWLLGASWLFGLGPAMGLGLAYAVAPDAVWQRHRLWILCLGIGVGIGIDGLVLNWLNIVLPSGWLVETIQAWFNIG